MDDRAANDDVGALAESSSLGCVGAADGGGGRRDSSEKHVMPANTSLASPPG